MYDISGFSRIPIAGQSTIFDNPGYGTPIMPQDFSGAMEGISVPGISGGGSGGFGSLDFGQKLGFGLQGLSTLGNLLMGFKQLSLAKKQFEFQKKFSTANLINSVKTYNTSLADRLNARQVMQTGSTAGAQAQIDANKLTTNGI